MSSLTVYRDDNPARYLLGEQKIAKIEEEVHNDKSYKTLNTALRLFAENPGVSPFIKQFPDTCLKLVAMLPDVKFQGQNDLTVDTVRKVIRVFCSSGLFELAISKDVIIPCLDGEVYTNKSILCFSNPYFKKLLEEQNPEVGEKYVLNLNFPTDNGIVPNPPFMKKHYVELLLELYFKGVVEICLAKDEWPEILKLALLLERDSNDFKFLLINTVLQGSDATVEIFETLFLLLRSNSLDPTIKFDLETYCLKLLLDKQEIAYNAADNGFYLNIKDLYILDSKSIINRTLLKHVRGIIVDPQEQAQHLDFFMFLDEKIRSKLKFIKPTKSFTFDNFHFLTQNAENYRMKILSGQFLFDNSLPYQKLELDGGFSIVSSADFISILELIQKNGIDTITSHDHQYIRLDDNLHTYLMKLDKKIKWKKYNLYFNFCAQGKDRVKFTLQPTLIQNFQEKIEKTFGVKSRESYGTWWRLKGQNMCFWVEQDE